MSSRPRHGARQSRSALARCGEFALLVAPIACSPQSSQAPIGVEVQGGAGTSPEIASSTSAESGAGTLDASGGTSGTTGATVGPAGAPSTSAGAAGSPVFVPADGGSGGVAFTAAGATSGAHGGAMAAGAAAGGAAGANVGGTTAGGSNGGSAGNAGGSASNGPRARFTNPLNPNFGSDPWMIHYEGQYYLAATTWDQDVLTMKHGATIEELKNATPEVIWQPGAGDGPRSRAMWAPEFFLLDDGTGEAHWYFYFTAGDGSADFVGQRSHVLESEGTDPMGPYTFRSTLLDYWAIDGSVLDVGGTSYFLFSAWDGPTQNVYIQRMSNPWTLTGSRTLLTLPEYPWEQEGTAQVNEGPEPLYHDGRIFLTYSASQCGSPGYKLGLLELTGSDPLDAGSWWKSPEPVFQAANGNYSTAHNGFFRSPDGTEDWLVYHGVSNPEGSCWIDRTTRIQPFTWTADGLPDFGEPISLNAEIPVPSGE